LFAERLMRETPPGVKVAQGIRLEAGCRRGPYGEDKQIGGLERLPIARLPLVLAKFMHEEFKTIALLVYGSVFCVAPRVA
jgi:hypothetical protein